MAQSHDRSMALDADQLWLLALLAGILSTASG